MPLKNRKPNKGRSQFRLCAARHQPFFHLHAITPLLKQHRQQSTACCRYRCMRSPKNISFFNDVLGLAAFHIDNFCFKFNNIKGPFNYKKNTLFGHANHTYKSNNARIASFRRCNSASAANALAFQSISGSLGGGGGVGPNPSSPRASRTPAARASASFWR